MHPDDAIVGIFIEEAEENLEAVEDGLLTLEKSPTNQNAINSVFRAIHTIKGGAGLAGLHKIGRISHEFEEILEDIRSSGRGLEQDVFTLLFAGVDLLKRMIGSGEPEGDRFDQDIKHIIELVSLYKQSGSSSGPETEGVRYEHDNTEADAPEDQNTYLIDMTFGEDTFATGTDPVMLLMELQEEGKILASYLRHGPLPKLSELDPHQCHLSWLVFFQSDKSLEEVYDVFMFVRDDNDIHVEAITDELTLWFSDNSQLRAALLDRFGFAAWEVDEVVSSQETFGKGFISSESPSDEVATAAATATATEESVLEPEQKEKINSIRVDTRKLEQMINSMGEMVIAQSRVKEVVSGIGLERTDMIAVFNAFAEVDKIIRRVQEEVMATSMVPIGATFTRFQRMVRDLLKDQGKQAEFVLKGTETELDRKVIEQIVDPLKHLIRNSIDHGLETPRERLENDKPESGMLCLNAYHQEGFIVIEICDDGRGVNRQAILRKAREKGLVEEGVELSDDEINALIFRPGFSTAKEVSDISGRGVGLDVVLNNIQSLRGSVSVVSEPGQGTTFRIRLPLTLAIIDGVVIRLGDQLFVVPVTAISEFIKIDNRDIHLVEGRGSVIDIRSEFIPYIPLHKMIGLDAEHTEASSGIVIILKEGDKRLAVLIDEILGHEQVVVKNIQENLGVGEGMAGATILGDGRVSIIFDVASLFRIARRYVKAL